MSHPTFDVRSLVQKRLAYHQISLSIFANLLGVSKASVSRWLSGAAAVPNDARSAMKSCIDDIDKLCALLYPVVPDLTNIESARHLLRLVRENRLWAAVRAVDDDEAKNLTRDELVEAGERYRAGLQALADKSLAVRDSEVQPG